MTTSLVSRDKAEAKKKGMLAGAAWGGTALLAVLTTSAFLVVPAAGGAAYMTYKWFMFRAKRGMRF